MFVELVWLVDLGDTTGLHHHHPIADRQGFGLIMGDHQRGNADFVLNAADLELHLFAQVGVQVGQRLVEQQHWRLDYQCAGQCDPLALTTGQLARVALGMLTEAHQLQHPFDTRVQLGGRHLAHPQAKCNVVGHGHVRKQRIALKHYAEASAARFGVGDVAPVEHNAPVTDFNETGDHLQGGGFAAAGRAEQ